jgi:hypothetical protein
VDFRTVSNRSGFIGLIVAGGLVAGAVGLGSVIVLRGGLSLNQPLSPVALGASAALLLDLVGLALVVYWSIAALGLHYQLDRNGLVIRWGASRTVVPIERIQAVASGSEIETEGGGPPRWRAFRGVGWAGLRVGHARLPDNKPAHVFTTTSLAQSTVVLTPDSAYVVSPREPGAFVEAWNVRRPLGPTQYWQEGKQRAWLLDLPLWSDRLAWVLVGLGLLASLAMQGYLTCVFEQLPSVLTFHFNVLGQPDRIASRTEILRLPQIALLMLVLDLGLGFVIYRRERAAALLIWGGGGIVQLLVWGAVLTIIG